MVLPVISVLGHLCISKVRRILLCRNAAGLKLIMTLRETLSGSKLVGPRERGSMSGQKVENEVNNATPLGKAEPKLSRTLLYSTSK